MMKLLIKQFIWKSFLWIYTKLIALIKKSSNENIQTSNAISGQIHLDTIEISIHSSSNCSILQDESYFPYLIC